MRSGNLCMSEPRLDRQEVYARLKQDHGERVPKDMRRDPLSRELGHMLGCCGDGATHDMGGAESGQTLSARSDEYRHVLVPSNVALA